MKHLFILRHAKAKATSLTGDHGRHLSQKGRQQAEAVGSYLKDHNLLPDIILSSSAKRTLETVECIEPFLENDQKISVSDRLYLAPITHLLESIWTLSDKFNKVLLVGHNPGLHDLAYSLNCDPDGAKGSVIRDHFPTATLALFQFELDHWQEIDLRRGQLDEVIIPQKL